MPVYLMNFVRVGSRVRRMKKKKHANRGKELADATITGNALDQAIFKLVRKIPLRWKQLNSDSLTTTEQEALKLLTAAGLVERRFTFRLSLIGHPVNIEATITATGEYGLIEGMKPVVKAAWEAWADSYLKGKAGAEQDKPVFHCERAGPEQARLTDQGELSKKDIIAGNTKVVLDFVHRRTAVFFGMTIRGQGRAEMVRTESAPAAPMKVELVNSGPIAAIAGTLEKFFDMQAKAQSSSGEESSAEATGIEPSPRIYLQSPEEPCGADATPPGRSAIPNDTISIAVVLREYVVSRHTVYRYIKDNKIHDYRPKDAPKNSPYLLSRAEIERHFRRN